MQTTQYPVRLALTEDHYLLRETLARTLEEEAGFCVAIKAENGQVLLDSLSNQTIDLIIVDIQMPVLDGYETFRKERERYPDIPVIFFSSFSFELVVGELKRIGAEVEVEAHQDEASGELDEQQQTFEKIYNKYGKEAV